jgi:uncharacterized delta-60 repeat protein
MILLLASAPAFAADGDLDPAFGSGGLVVTSFEFFSRITCLAIQPDGKILVGGETGGQDPAVLGRYNSDGTVDPTFNFEPLGVDSLTDLALLPDGRILYVGSGRLDDTASLDVLVARVEADGAGDGSVLTDFLGDGSTGDQAFAIAVQADGKIVVGGSTTAGAGGALILRYTSEGVLDPGFGTGGMVFTEIAQDGVRVEDLVLQPDGKIVAVVAVPGGEFGDPPFSAFLLMRFNADGTPDPGFGAGGTSTAPLGNPATAAAGALQPDGRLVVAGTVVVDGVGHLAVARYNADGSLDPTFSGDGLALLDGVEGAAADVVLLPDGRIVAGGEGFGGDEEDLLLARFLPDGTLDASFGTAGRVLTDFPSNSSQDGAAALALQADGKIVAAGSTFSDQNSMALARYLGGPRIATTVPTLDGLGLVLLAVLLLGSGAVMLRRRRAPGTAS